MIRLRTLGSPDLKGADGAPIENVLRQPKRLALLVYLALAPRPGFVRRDTLLALFWPEMDDSAARNALNQALHFLRAELPDAFKRRGDEIGVDGDAVWCDAVAFLDLLAVGQLEEALELYTGNLLEGLNLHATPEFERWLDETRADLRMRAAGAARSLSERAEAAGDYPRAVSRLREAITIAPFSEACHRHLMALLDAQGDRAGALRAYDELCQLLQAEYETAPAPETTELANTIRARSESAGLTENVVAILSPRSITRLVRKKRRVAFALLSVGLIAIAILRGADKGEVANDPPQNRIAVLYFNDASPRGDLGHIADGLTTTLIEQLGQIRQLEVISQNGVRPFRGQALPLDSIAGLLDVRMIVGGSLTRSGDLLRITVELVDGHSGIAVRSTKLERPMGELFALLDEASTQAADFLRSALGQEIRLKEWLAETGNVEAWELLKRAEYAIDEALESERHGAAQEAWAKLAYADSLLERAAELDRRAVAPVVKRGQVAARRAWLSLAVDRPPNPARWLTNAQQLAERALALNQKSAEAHELRGVAQYWRWLLARPAGQRADSLIKDAENSLLTAVRVSPELPRAQSVLSTLWYSQGRFEESRQAARRALNADAYLTDAGQIVNRMFQTSFELADDAEAGYWCDQVRRRQPTHWPSAYCDLALLAWGTRGSPDARKALYTLENFGADDSDATRTMMRPRLMMVVAAVLARTGARDSAEAMLLRAKQTAPADPELLYFEAAARTLLRQDDRALGLLREYLRKNPAAVQRTMNSRAFRPMREQVAVLAQQP